MVLTGFFFLFPTDSSFIVTLSYWFNCQVDFRLPVFLDISLAIGVILFHVTNACIFLGLSRDPLSALLGVTVAVTSSFVHQDHI